MVRRLVLLVAAAAFITAKAPGVSPNDPVAVTVHEWGTFTSVAGPDGKALEWLPQSGPVDLPSFVERARYSTKGCLSGTVRMETPVLYFYAPDEAAMNVSVRFRQGVMTEWYPSAAASPRSVNDSILRSPDVAGSVSWRNVKVVPHAAEDFPDEGRPNHYYAARHTDASPLRVGRQTEKFLFYRGVGRFEPRLSAIAAADGTIRVEAIDGGSIGDVILFEKRGGRTAYAVRRQLPSQAELAPLAPAANSNGPIGDLEQLLVAHGMYPKEASAMVATWRDSWFEEGTRLLYILPPETVDWILPLEITPAPVAVARVFVGRVEIITPATQQAVGEAIARDDYATIGKYGRFLRPIADRLLAQSNSVDRPALEQRLAAVYSRFAPVVGCR